VTSLPLFAALVLHNWSKCPPHYFFSANVLKKSQAIFNFFFFFFFFFLRGLKSCWKALLSIHRHCHQCRNSTLKRQFRVQCHKKYRLTLSCFPSQSFLTKKFNCTALYTVGQCCQCSIVFEMNSVPKPWLEHYQSKLDALFRTLVQRIAFSDVLCCFFPTSPMMHPWSKYHQVSISNFYSSSNFGRRIRQKTNLVPRQGIRFGYESNGLLLFNMLFLVLHYYPYDALMKWMHPNIITEWLSIVNSGSNPSGHRTAQHPFWTLGT